MDPSCRFNHLMAINASPEPYVVASNNAQRRFAAPLLAVLRGMWTYQRRKFSTLL